MGLDITRYDYVRVEKKSTRHTAETLHSLGYIRGSAHNDVYDRYGLPNLYDIFGECCDPRYDYAVIIGGIEILWERIPLGLEKARTTKCGLCERGYGKDARAMVAIDFAIEMLEDMLITRKGLHMEFVD